MSELPYCEEAYVLPVSDPEFATRVGVLARWSGGFDCQFNLERLRNDLAPSVPSFMLPTALRVLREGEKPAQTNSEKLAKAATIEKFFGSGMDVELWNLEF